MRGDFFGFKRKNEKNTESDFKYRAGYQDKSEPVLFKRAKKNDNLLPNMHTNILQK